MAPKKIVIVGGGLVGSLAALVLADSPEKYQVHVYELREDLRQAPHVRGRSINLALSTRGLATLQKAGVAKQVQEMLIPMYGRMLHSPEGALTEVPYGVFGEAINSVDRRKLNEMLLTEAEKRDNVRLFFQHAVETCDFDANELTFINKVTGETVQVKADLIIGADGAYSHIRRDLMRRTRMNYSQEYIQHGYMELIIQPNAQDDYAISANHLHIWPRHEYMMIALPNLDQTFTTTLFLPFEMFDQMKGDPSGGEIMRLFENKFADSIEWLGGKDALVSAILDNPVGPLMSVKCTPYNYKDKVVIIGDASHAMVPFYGQGMNAGFEDVLILDAFLHGTPLPQQLSINTPLSLLPSGGIDLETRLNRYTEYRHPDASSICDLAMYNYIEMRSSVLSYGYRIRKFIESSLHRVMPRQVIPLYSMIRYSEVVRQWHRQTEWLHAASIILALIGTGAGLFSLRGSSFAMSLLTRIKSLSY